MNHRHVFRSLFTGILTVSILAVPTAWGACTSPAGVDGEMKWISPNMVYCNNTTWQAMNNTVTATACTGAGKVQFNSSKVQYCNGSFWVETAPAVNHGACTAVDAGKFYYDSVGKYYWFCSSTFWRRMAP